MSRPANATRTRLAFGAALALCVAGAHAAGMDALLVLTGVTSHADGWVDPPEHVLASAADILTRPGARPTTPADSAAPG